LGHAELGCSGIGVILGMGVILLGNHAGLGKLHFAGEISLGPLVLGGGIGELGVEGLRIDLHKKIAGPDAVIVLDGHLLDDSGNLRSDVVDVPSDVGIIGGLMQEVEEGVLGGEEHADHPDGDEDPLAVVRLDLGGLGRRSGR